MSHEELAKKLGGQIIEYKGVGLDKTIAKVKVDDLTRGLVETSPIPVGNWRTSWIMQLSRQKGLCTLPRGFGFLSGKRI